MVVLFLKSSCVQILNMDARNFPKAQGSGDYNDKLDKKRDSVPYNFCKNIQN